MLHPYVNFLHKEVKLKTEYNLQINPVLLQIMVYFV